MVDQVIQCEVIELYGKFECIVSKAIETGLGFVLVNEHNKVIMAHIVDDNANSYPKNVILSSHNSLSKRSELFKSARNNFFNIIKSTNKYPELTSLESSMNHTKKNCIYGKYINGSFIAILPEYRRKKLSKLLYFGYAIIASLGYIGLAASVNNTVIQDNNKSQFFYFGDYIPLYNFKFEDGTVLNDKYFNDNRINHLKFDSKIIYRYIDFAKAVKILNINTNDKAQYIRIMKSGLLNRNISKM